MVLGCPAWGLTIFIFWDYVGLNLKTSSSPSLATRDRPQCCNEPPSSWTPLITAKFGFENFSLKSCISKWYEKWQAGEGIQTQPSLKEVIILWFSATKKDWKKWIQWTEMDKTILIHCTDDDRFWLFHFLAIKSIDSRTLKAILLANFPYLN